MIRHIVMFSAKDPQDTAKVFKGLQMLETIQGNWTLSVHQNLNMDQIGNDIDVVVYGEFPDEEALQTYKSHPTYQDCITVVRPLREIRMAANIKG